MTEYHTFAEALEHTEENERPKGPGPSKLDPAVVIPTFWTKESRAIARDHSDVKPYEHPTDIEDPNPGLGYLLASLSGKPKVGKVILVVRVTDRVLMSRAEKRVRDIVDNFPELDIFVLGEVETGSLLRRMDELDLGSMVPSIDLDSYGAARNLGLIAASVFGKDSVIFIDDDEVVEDEHFIETGLFGLGLPIQKGGYLYAKSGYYINEDGSWQHANDDKSIAGVVWRQADAYNKAISYVMQPPRLQRARIAFGGCLAVHKEMYTQIAFDPWVMRGEDIDYLINIRLHGGEMYIDDKWSAVHNSEGVISSAARFRQNIYRFIYEHRKLEFAKSQVDLARVTADSLDPWPGDFVDSSIELRARITALLHTIFGPERGEYWHAGAKTIHAASEYARQHCADYFALQRAWNFMMNKLWEDVPLGSLYSGERKIDRTAYTGEFRAV